MIEFPVTIIHLVELPLISKNSKELPVTTYLSMEVLLTYENSMSGLLTPVEAHAITWYNIEYNWQVEFKNLFHHWIEFN